MLYPAELRGQWLTFVRQSACSKDKRGQMATIERRKSRGKTVYYAKVRIKGQAQSSTFHSLSEAKEWAQRVEVGILEGKVSPVKHTLLDLLDCYMAEVLLQKKASTIPTQRAQLLWWKRYLGQWQLSEITPIRCLFRTS